MCKRYRLLKKIRAWRKFRDKLLASNSDEGKKNLIMARPEVIKLETVAGWSSWTIIYTADESFLSIHVGISESLNTAALKMYKHYCYKLIQP